MTYWGLPWQSVVKTSASSVGGVVRSLVSELRSHMHYSQKKQNVKQKQYCNKFNKDFKNGTHQKR